jgi:hypothetical protein
VPTKVIKKVFRDPDGRVWRARRATGGHAGTDYVRMESTDGMVRIGGIPAGTWPTITAMGLMDCYLGSQPLPRPRDVAPGEDLSR